MWAPVTAQSHWVNCQNMAVPECGKKRMMHSLSIVDPHPTRLICRILDEALWFWDWWNHGPKDARRTTESKVLWWKEVWSWHGRSKWWQHWSKGRWQEWFEGASARWFRMRGIPADWAGTAVA